MLLVAIPLPPCDVFDSQNNNINSLPRMRYTLRQHKITNYSVYKIYKYSSCHSCHDNNGSLLSEILNRIRIITKSEQYRCIASWRSRHSIISNPDNIEEDNIIDNRVLLSKIILMMDSMFFIYTIMLHS